MSRRRRGPQPEIRPQSTGGWTKPVLISTGIAFLSLTMSGLQWWTNRQANQIATRAWIVVDSLTASFEVGKPLGVRVDFKNTGTTPAIDLVGQAIMDPQLPGGKPQYEKPEEDAFHLGALPAGSTRTATMVISWSKSTGRPAPLTQEMVNAIRQDQVNAYVVGRVDYSDIFGKAHRTLFCYRLNPGNKLDGEVEWDVCPEHNEVY